MLRAIFCGGVMGCGSMLANVGWAHPGHGTSDGQGVVHYVVEPNHLLPWLVAVVLVLILRGAAVRVGRTAAERQRS